MACLGAALKQEARADYELVFFQSAPTISSLIGFCLSTAQSKGNERNDELVLSLMEPP
jgi:hypothetical protein